MSKWDCIEWWEDRYDRPLERSTCVGWSYQSRQRWVETMRRWPDLDAEAVDTDARMRDQLAFAKESPCTPGVFPSPRSCGLTRWKRAQDRRGTA